MHVNRKHPLDGEQSLKLEITYLRFQLKGEGVQWQWIDWGSSFGEVIPKHPAITPEEKQKHLQGLFDRIESRFLTDTGDEEPTIHLNTLYCWGQHQVEQPHLQGERVPRREMLKHNRGRG